MEARSATDQDAILCAYTNGKPSRRSKIDTNYVHLEAVVAKEEEGSYRFDPRENGDGRGGGKFKGKVGANHGDPKHDGGCNLA